LYNFDKISAVKNKEIYCKKNITHAFYGFKVKNASHQYISKIYSCGILSKS
jgi:hypothetical protein